MSRHGDGAAIEVNRIRIDTVENRVEEIEEKLDAAIDTLGKIKGGIYWIAGLAAGNLFGVKEIIQRIL